MAGRKIKLRQLVFLGLGAAVLTVSPLTPAYADTVPGKNGKIAFTSTRDGNDEIYVMDVDGSNQVNLTNNAASDTSPAWSPDGTKLAFVSGRDGNNEIYTMNADGSGVIRLTNNTDGDYDPTWSPDGSQIAFTRALGFGREIHVMDADGTNEVAITTNFSDDLNPSWSPDGTKIAASQYVAGSQFNLITLNPDGTNEQHLPNAGSTASWQPSWSPDSLQIVFANNRTGNMEIFVTDVDETNAANQVNLTNNAAADVQPSWSPDGTMIAFQSNRDGNENIYVMNSDGSSQTALTSNAASDTEPVWQSLQPVTPPSPAPVDPSSPTTPQPTENSEVLANTGRPLWSIAIIAALAVLFGASFFLISRKKKFF